MTSEIMLQFSKKRSIFRDGVRNREQIPGSFKVSATVYHSCSCEPMRIVGAPEVIERMITESW